MNAGKLLREVEERSLSYGSVPFWSWNDRLEESELRRQIRNMHEMKMRGFFMHARFGLETEYMSDEWFRAVEVCIDEAKKLGMEAWCYDENGWPSGFGGGELLKDEENLARFLKYSVEDSYPSDALGVYLLKDGVCRRITESVEGEKEYHVIRVGRDESYVDLLNPEVTRRFLDCTYEVYKKRLKKEDFGTVMPGFFTDEPQYFRWATPWSFTLPEAFWGRYGYDMTEHLLKLFVECEGYREFRYDFHDLIARLYVQSFIKQIYEWCETNGCRITGHSIEEAGLAGQMMCAGGVMPFYEYQHVPGIDWLGRRMKKDLMPKQLGSVCAQTGKKKSLTETFALCGWDVSPKELKNIADFQYVNGVNTTCQHLYSYSYRGQRKRDYPAHYGPQLPWQEHLADFNLYYNHLGYFLSRGEEAAPLLVIHPIHNAYMYYAREQEQGGIKESDRKFAALSDFLACRQLLYHYGDETMLERLGAVEGTALRLGKCRYSKVLIPEVESLDASTAELLKEYLAAGGRLYREGTLPTRINGRVADLSFLKDARPMKELLEDRELTLSGEEGDLSELRVQMRNTPEGRLIFVTNVGTKRYSKVRIRLKNCRNLVRAEVLSLALSSVTGEALPDGSFELLCEIGDSESFVLLESGAPAALPIGSFAPASTEGFLPPRRARLSAPVQNAMALDTVDYRLNGGEWVENVPLMQVKDELLQSRAKGELTLRYRFRVDELPVSLRLACEKAPYRSLRINGRELALSDRELWLDPCFLTADLMEAVRVGENEITCTIDYFQRDYVYYVLFGGVSESLRNCLNFDTEIECMYLYGDFAVKTPGRFEAAERQAFCYYGGFAIEKSRDSVELSNLITDGYPFFAGSIGVEFEKDYAAGDPTLLRLDGRCAVCEVWVNGKKAGKTLFERSCELKDFLKVGKNHVRLVLTNANRNLLGPLHHPEAEPLSVSPWTFTGEKRWKNGECEVYCKDRYCFMRFGLNTEEEK